MTVAYSCRSMPTISRFMASDAFIRGLVGPLGGGKSSGCVWDLAQRGVAQRPGLDGVRRSRWAVIRNTSKQLDDSTIRTFLAWFPPHIHGTWLPSKGNYTIRSLKAAADEPSAEIEFNFRALDRPDQIGNLLSTEYTGGWINEGREVPWAIFEALMGRVGRFPAMRDGGASWFGIISDTNAPDTDSRWYKFFHDTNHAEAVEALSAALVKRGLPPIKLQDYAQCFRQPSGRGPNAENLPNLTPAYYERLAIGKSDDWNKVYIDGEYGFTVDGLPVFPEYSDSWHCPEEEKSRPKLIGELPIYRSFDFGLTPACVFSQITPAGQWIITDELVATDMGFDQFSDEVLEYSNRNMRGCSFVNIGDPAGQQRAQTDERTCFAIASAKGMRMEAAPQTLRIRLEGTRKPLRLSIGGGKPQFLLHPRCRNLRKAMLGGYHYRRLKVSADRYTDEPDKGPDSHVADALTYAGAYLFGPALQAMPLVENGDRDSPLMDQTRSRTTGY